MRKTILATAASALAAAALVAGAGTAAADDGEEQGTIPERLLSPAMIDSLGSIGYGSAGTGSLMDLVTGVINFGSTTLSLDVPSSIGWYAPGSTGSYGPLAPVGEVLTASVAVIGGTS